MALSIKLQYTLRASRKLFFRGRTRPWGRQLNSPELEQQNTYISNSGGFIWLRSRKTVKSSRENVACALSLSVSTDPRLRNFSCSPTNIFFLKQPTPSLLLVIWSLYCWAHIPMCIQIFWDPPLLHTLLFSPNAFPAGPILNLAIPTICVSDMKLPHFHCNIFGLVFRVGTKLLNAPFVKKH